MFSEKIPIRVCRRCGPDRSLLFRATSWYFAAALHTLLTFLAYAGLWRDEVVNTIAVFLWFHSVQLDQLSERIQPWHPCQWFLVIASLAFRFSAEAVLEIVLVAPLQSRSCSATSLRPLATKLLLYIFHRWIALFAPTSWLLDVILLNDRWHRSLKRRTRYPTTYSTGLLVYHMQLMLLLWQELLPALLVADHLRPSQSLISLPMMQLCLLISWIRRGDECRNSLVQESVEHRLDCSSDFASSSDVVNGPSILETSQSGQSTSVSRAYRIALL